MGAPPHVRVIVVELVDRADRLRALYGVDRKSPKWRHRLFWGILDITFINAYIIHSLSSRNYISSPGPSKNSKCSHCSIFLCINEKKNCFAEYHDANL